MSKELLPLPEGECSEWLQHGQRVNAFPYPKKPMSEQCENERKYWVPKGFDAAPLFTADQMREYALANLQAAKPADHCMCDHCKDGVLHDSDCAVHNKGVPDLLGPCDCSAKPADAPGSLPVVAYVSGRYERDGYNDEITAFLPIATALTDHAQATAELAKRDEIIERYSMCIRENQAEIERLRDKLEQVKQKEPAL